MLKLLFKLTGRNDEPLSQARMIRGIVQNNSLPKQRSPEKSARVRNL